MDIDNYSFTLNPCRAPTIEFDVFLDCFFIFEIAYTFFVAFDNQGVSTCFPDFFVRQKAERKSESESEIGCVVVCVCVRESGLFCRQTARDVESKRVRAHTRV